MEYEWHVPLKKVAMHCSRYVEIGTAGTEGNSRVSRSTNVYMQPLCIPTYKRTTYLRLPAIAEHFIYACSCAYKRAKRLRAPIIPIAIQLCSNTHLAMSSQDISTSSGNDSNEKPGVVNKSDTTGPSRHRSRQYIRRPIESTRFRQDHRSRMPDVISRFVGYRPLKTEPPSDSLPFPPFTWLTKIPVRLEV